MSDELDTTIDETETEADPDGLLGDAVWTTKEVNNRPDAAFACIEPGGEKDSEGKTTPRSKRHLVHHTQGVKKGTENSTVDLPHLRNALARCSQMKVSASLKKEAENHLKAHARALNVGDAEVAALIGDQDEAPDYEARLKDTNTFAEAEALVLEMAEAEVDPDIMAEAEARLQELAAVDREHFDDEFSGVVESVKQDGDGLWHFTARVAQADKTNKNKRYYPKEEFEANLARVNRLAKAGRFSGRDGHVMWGDDKPSEICVRYDAVMLQGDDLVMEGVLVPTQAGENLGTLWANGVQTEWSIVGYGKAEAQTDDNGNITHVVIRDYILDGCDPVRRGAANTRTLKMKRSKEGLEGDGVADEVESEAIAVEVADEADPEVVTEAVSPVPEVTLMGDELKVEETKEEPKAPEIDVKAITDAAMAEAKEATKGLVADAVAAALTQAKLETAKDAAIAKLSEGDEMVAKVVSKFVSAAESIEDVAKAVEEATPLALQMKKPKTVNTSGFFVHENKDRARFMIDGTGKVIDRPETVEGVKEALVAGIEDNGREDASNKRWCMEKIVENYERDSELKRCLWSMTRQGFPNFMDSASTTTALGTTLPMVLPIIRNMLPNLIPYDIASVVPISTPEARVYFQDMQYKAGTNGSGADGSNIDDSSVFDTAWPDHTEADTKSQIGFTYSYQTVSAVEKSIFWDYTSALMQDSRAYYNMDVEASFMETAVRMLTLSVNMSFVETLAAGAGLSGTFGTGLPASGFDNLNDWLSWGLSQYLNRASAQIAEKMYESAGWIVCGGTQATLFEASNSYSKLPAGSVKQFGSGLRQVGTWANLYDVYVCDWAETLSGLKNKMLIGYRPPTWDQMAAVFCPYVPLYMSPADSVPSTNTMSHSVSTRNGYKVLQANGLYKLTISSATGTPLTYVN